MSGDDLQVDVEVVQEEIVNLEKTLTERNAEFHVKRGREPAMGDIEADPEWLCLYSRKKRLERLAAAQRDGGCKAYITRRRRFCANKAGDGLGGFCSEHFAQERGIETLSKLPLEEVTGQGKRNLKRRMKRMTNPSASQFQVPAPAPEWGSIYEDMSLPLMLDIGCAKGRFLAQLAVLPDFEAQFGKHNFCGVEIFGPLVAAANLWRDNEKLRNLHYIAANINTSFRSLAFPNLSRVCIQFPDPWHLDNVDKRVVTPKLVEEIADALPSGGEVFLVSDMEFLWKDMVSTFLQSENCQFELHPRHLAACDVETGMTHRPYIVPTERDKVCEMKWRPIFRTLLRRK